MYSLYTMAIPPCMVPFYFSFAFACTDIINELYGYHRVRNVINTTAVALMIMGYSNT